MITKTFSHSLYFLVFLFITNYAVATTETRDESALYALSSLNSHILQELAPEGGEQRIHFSKKDVENLWLQAMNSSEGQLIERAWKYYKISRSVSPNEVRSHLEKVKEITQEAWKKLNPFFNISLSKRVGNHYLLPNTHWLKSHLDDIFTTWEANKNQEIFEQAGFTTLCKRTSSMIVAKHATIPGYLIKTYLETDKPQQTWKWMINRCLGAENIRILIRRKKLRHFIVPEKWIYPLPNAEINPDTLTVDADEKAPAVLVVTRMYIGDVEQSKWAWKNSVTRKHLRELYCILSYGLASCYLPQNIPYTRDGQFTCLDTEYPCREHRLERIRSKLSTEMAAYWDLLVRSGGNPNRASN